MNLLAVSHQRISRQWIVVLPACQLPHAPHRAVDGPEPRTVALAPDHTFVMGRQYFAPALDKGAIRIEEKLSVVERPTISFVDADGHHDIGLSASVADRCRRG